MCDCGHCFVLKCKVSGRKSARIAMRSKRALQTIGEIMCTSDMAKKRALETTTETELEQNRVNIAKKSIKIYAIAMFVIRCHHNMM